MIFYSICKTHAEFPQHNKPNHSTEKQFQSLRNISNKYVFILVHETFLFIVLGKLIFSVRFEIIEYIFIH